MSKLYDYEGKKVIEIYVTPEEFGAIGNGTNNDTVALQNAVNQKGLILFGSGKNYKVTSTIRLQADTILDLNGATITCTDNHLFFNFLGTDTFTGYSGNGNIIIRNGTIVGGGISFGHGENIRLENIIFQNCLNDHWLEIAGCKNYVIEGCVFSGVTEQSASRNIVEHINFDPCTRAAFPWLPDGSAFFDGTKNNGVKVNNCKFIKGTGDYAYDYVALGVHGIDTDSTLHIGVVFTNNEIIDLATCGLHINNMQDVYIANNKITTIGDCIKVGDVASVDELVIINNYLDSVDGSVVVLTEGEYTNLTKDGNILRGTVES